jgi:hypothetical protein
MQRDKTESRHNNERIFFFKKGRKKEKKRKEKATIIKERLICADDENVFPASRQGQEKKEYSKIANQEYYEFFQIVEKK